MLFGADPGEVELLMQSGASTLALQILDTEQSKPETSPEQWLQWESRRISLYRQKKDWHSLINRLKGLPKETPVDYRRWAIEQVARAQIEKKNTASALETLRDLVWNYSRDNEGKLIEGVLPVWRQLIIQAYLVGGNSHDAETAMLRYEQDNSSPTDEWKRLRATVLILTGKPYDAQVLMARQTHMHSRTIYYLAQLKAGKVKPGVILSRTRTLARKKKFSSTTRRQFWVIASRAAREKGDYVSAIRALQNALLLINDKQSFSQVEKLLFPVSGDDLWRLYEGYGRMLGNQLQLLIGNDEAWFTTASNLMDKKPMQAMALFAVLSRDSQRQQTRKLAYELFATLLGKHKQGLSLLQKLYLVKAQHEKVKYIPEEIRRRLVDKALSNADIAMASLLIKTVTEPPKGTDRLFWMMRRARIMILAGELDNGVQALKDLLKESPALDPKQMDRMIQVLFDLQTVGRHHDAIELFGSLPLEGHRGQLKREILYWIADSYKSEKKYMQAARFYLRSAGLLDNRAMDPWAQTARYHAAEALMSAGDYEDASRLYNKLLAITKESSRRVVIRNKIQQIWLQSNKGNHAASGSQHETE